MVPGWGGVYQVNGENMNQMEELKAFVSERLKAVACEIFGAIEKTVTDYEEQACRLKEDNDRHRSLLDIILKTKLTQTEGGSKTRLLHLPDNTDVNRVTGARRNAVISLFHPVRNK